MQVNVEGKQTSVDFTEGYLELEEGILVKINPSAESVIKIQKK